MNSVEMNRQLERMWDRVGASRGSAIPLTDPAVAHLLAVTADLSDRMPCRNQYCEQCELTYALWWDVCNRLERSVRVTLQAHLRASGIELPPGPVEEIPNNVVPFTRV